MSFSVFILRLRFTIATVAMLLLHNHDFHRASGFMQMRTMELPSFGEFTCPKPGYFPVKSNCSRYYRCIFAGLNPFSVLSCNSGDRFDPVNRACDRADVVDCQRCAYDGSQADARSSQNYINCTNGHGSRIRCQPPGNVFDPVKKQCQGTAGTIKDNDSGSSVNIASISKNQSCSQNSSFPNTFKIESSSSATTSEKPSSNNSEEHGSGRLFPTEFQNSRILNTTNSAKFNNSKMSSNSTNMQTLNPESQNPVKSNVPSRFIRSTSDSEQFSGESKNMTASGGGASNGSEAATIVRGSDSTSNSTDSKNFHNGSNTSANALNHAAHTPHSHMKRITDKQSTFAVSRTQTKFSTAYKSQTMSQEINGTKQTSKTESDAVSSTGITMNEQIDSRTKTEAVKNNAEPETVDVLHEEIVANETTIETKGANVETRTETEESKTRKKLIQSKSDMAAAESETSFQRTDSAMNTTNSTLDEYLAEVENDAIRQPIDIETLNSTDSLAGTRTKTTENTTDSSGILTEKEVMESAMVQTQASQGSKFTDQLNTKGSGSYQVQRQNSKALAQRESTILRKTETTNKPEPEGGKVNTMGGFSNRTS